MSRQERIARVEERLRRCFGSGMRLSWDRGRKRFVVQEKGRRTGAWQYVIECSAPDGSYREPGEWLLARLHAADMTVVQAGARGAQKLRLMRDTNRRRRMMQRVVKETEQFSQEILPRVLAALSAQGFPVPRGKITAEEYVEQRRRRGMRGDELDLLRDNARDITTHAKLIIPAAHIPTAPNRSARRRLAAKQRTKPC